MSALREIPALSYPTYKQLAAFFMVLFSVVSVEGQSEKRTFNFGTEKTRETSDAADSFQKYSSERGYGFGMGTFRNVQLEENSFTAASPVYFSVHVPEGNYRIEVVLGSDKRDSETSVKAESRRLMLREVQVKKGEQRTEKFVINVRRPEINSEEAINLKSREVNDLNWDDKMTLEFSGEVAVRSISIEPVAGITTLFLAGDSTVTDQDLEPWASWGQMITRYFTPGLVVANYAASGASLNSFKARKRLKKVLDLMKPGDYLVIQFGHNDQKAKGEGVGPWQSYTNSLVEYVNSAREKGGIPVLVTPVQRRFFDAEGKLTPTHGDYPGAVRKVAEDHDVPLIDLTEMTTLMYESWGDELSRKAFVQYPANTFPGQEEELKDNTHFNSFGAHEIALAVISGIRELDLELKDHLKPEAPAYDASSPNNPESWRVPESPRYESTKPEGN